MEPEDLTFQLLQEITDDFSEERILGAGTYGVVYRGTTKNGEDVAVKKLFDTIPGPHYRQFQNELYNLMMLKHQNIVQILGYCYETEQKPATAPDGSKVLADETYRALCFEYMHNGSLQKHLSDEFSGLDWHTRFKIIKGTCEGLKYIHEDLEEPIYHLDLKPDNLLLDKDMVPKIADFGLSRIFSEELTRNTRSLLGTLGYQPPEYINNGEISKKFDIFSLGVIIIQIVSGPQGYCECARMPNGEFVDQIQKNWRNRLQATCSGSYLEAYCHQVQTCTQIALNCVEKNSQKRIDIVKIIEKLNEIEIEISKLPRKGCHKTVSSNLKKMTKEPNEMTNQHQKSLNAGEDLIVGRYKERREIMTSLRKSMTQKIAILPIYGIGGIGKTTVAKLIYNDTYFRYYYKVWVHVTQIFELNKIQNSIISQILEMKNETNKRHVIHSWFSKTLYSNQILIVLDDLWEDNPFQLQELKDMLYHDDRNTVVLVTTRSKRVAERICTNLRPYKIEPLSNYNCWEIIRKRSNFDARDDKELLTGIGMEIAMKCGGAALAAQSIGFKLQSMGTYQWLNVKDSDIWNQLVSEDTSLPKNHALASLKLSYKSMAECLRSCFTYCAIFPKGYKIPKHDLIHQWISLGLIEPTKILSARQLCERYIVQLLGLSFLQNSVAPTAGGAYKKGVTLFTMHDLVHDLASSLMADKILDARKQGILGEQMSCPYALLTDCSKPLESSTSYPDTIRALRFVDCGQITLNGEAFSSAISLRVLDLSECLIYKLPDSMGELAQLRYLNAPKIQSSIVPKCITKLSKLTYLNLSGSAMLALPESIGEIEDLIHLDISDCSEIRELPESFFNLKRLVHLDLSRCRNLRMSKSLGGLTNLQYLNLSRERNIGSENSLGANYRRKVSLKGLSEVIGNLNELRYLGLSYTFGFGIQADGPSTTEIFRLVDRICTLSNLEHVDLSNNIGIATVPESIGNLRKLHTLDLSGCIDILSLPECMVKMDSLTIVDVTNCSDVLESRLHRSKIFSLLPHFVVHADDGESNSNIGMLRHANPKVLYISSLENVKSAEDARSIKLIEKHGIEDLKLEWSRDYWRGYWKDTEVLGELWPPSTLRKFIIKGYNGEMLPAWAWSGLNLYIPNLIEIRLCHLYKCKFLPPLGQLPHLKDLVFERMDNITEIKHDLFCGGAKAFPQLKKFCLGRMINLEVWNTMYSYSKDGVKEFMFPNLVLLVIIECPKLRLKPCPPRVKNWKIQNSNNVLSSWGKTCASPPAAVTNMSVSVTASKLPLNRWRLLCHLPAITMLSIRRCSDMTCSSPEIIKNISSIRSLHLEDNANPELPKWMGELKSLEKMSITNYARLDAPIEGMKQIHLLQLNNCISITTLLQWFGELVLPREWVTSWTELSGGQGSMGHLTSIKELYLNKCASITVLPEWLGKLHSLKTLEIRSCSGIKSLPESIQKLTKLERILISNCPELAKWWELDENKKKLAHIKKRYIW